MRADFFEVKYIETWTLILCACRAQAALPAARGARALLECWHRRRYIVLAAAAAADGRRRRGRSARAVLGVVFGYQLVNQRAQRLELLVTYQFELQHKVEEVLLRGARVGTRGSKRRTAAAAVARSPGGGDGGSGGSGGSGGGARSTSSGAPRR